MFFIVFWNLKLSMVGSLFLVVNEFSVLGFGLYILLNIWKFLIFLVLVCVIIVGENVC